MSDEIKSNAKVNGNEFTFYVEDQWSGAVTIKPCAHCGARSVDQVTGDHTTPNYVIISAVDANGDYVPPSDPDFQTAQKRLDRKMKNKKPMCLSCNERLEVAVPSE